MSVTIGADGTVLVNGTRILFPRDSLNHSAAMVGGFSGDNLVLGQFTSDGKLKVDASVTVDTIDIGTVNLQAVTAGGAFFPIGEVLNPDATTYALYVQDPRQTYTAGALNVKVGNASLPVTQSGTWTVALANESIMIGSVELSDGAHTAAVTAGLALKVDGSATTQPISGTVSVHDPGVDVYSYGEQAAVAASASIAATTYTVPDGYSFYLKHISMSGDCPALFVVDIDAAVVCKRRLSTFEFNTDMTVDSGSGLDGLLVAAGCVITLTVTNAGSSAANFNGTIYGRLAPV